MACPGMIQAIQPLTSFIHTCSKLVYWALTVDVLFLCCELYSTTWIEKRMSTALVASRPKSNVYIRDPSLAFASPYTGTSTASHSLPRPPSLACYFQVPRTYLAFLITFRISFLFDRVHGLTMCHRPLLFITSSSASSWIFSLARWNIVCGLEKGFHPSHDACP